MKQQVFTAEEIKQNNEIVNYVNSLPEAQRGEVVKDIFAGLSKMVRKYATKENKNES